MYRLGTVGALTLPARTLITFSLRFVNTEVPVPVFEVTQFLESKDRNLQ